MNITNISYEEILIKRGYKLSDIGWIDVNKDELQVRKEIEEYLGFKMPISCGNKIIVALYIREETIGKDVKFFLPESSRSEDKWKSCVGKVVAMGPDSYIGDEFPSGPYCKLGDWVVFPRNDGSMQVNNNEKVMQYIYDIKISGLTDDPTTITRC